MKRTQPPPAAPTQDPLPVPANDGLLPHERAARERAMKRTQPPPAAPTQDPLPVPANDGLLPHERAARERAMNRTQPPQATPTQDARPVAANDGLLPHERAAKERAMNRIRPAPPPQPPRPWPAETSQPIAQSNRLLPHEMAARDRAMGRRPLAAESTRITPSIVRNTGPLPRDRVVREMPMGRTHPPVANPQSPINNSRLVLHERTVKENANFDELILQSPTQLRPAPAADPTPKNTTPSWASAAPSWLTPAAAQPAWANPDAAKPPQQTNPLAFLLPHERAAREKAGGTDRPVQPASPPHQPDTFQDDVSRNFAALRSRRSRPSGITGALGDGGQNQVGQRDASAPTSQTPHGSTPRYDLPRPSSSLTQTPADQGDWKNLARRERSLPPGFSAAPSDFQVAPQAYASKPGANLFGSLGQNTAGRPQAGSPNAGVDQWKLLESQATRQDEPRRNGAAAEHSENWDWAEDYTEEARLVKAQRIARELRQEEQEPGEEATSSEVLPPRRDERDNRYGRVSRYARDEEVDEKPKKPKIRRREVNEDDDWDDDFYQEKRRRKAEKAARERERLAALEAAGPTPIFLPEFISVSNLAVALGEKIDVFVSQLEELGFEEVGKDNILTGETAALVAQEYGFEPTVDAGEDEDLKPAPVPANLSSLPLRPPVVTIMGHVDHGKTTLLDYLRKSSIVAQEHGGITQHIGAFSVSLSTGKQITFLDTPGHAAFLSMRQRGASVTDMVILVVAADDSVMPQTLEALKHARSAKVPIIVAINKVDKPEANIERVKSDLATHGVELEDYGGDVQVVCVSGRTGQGMDDLEENILLLSEMLDIRAEPDGLAEGWVLESTIKPIGRVATVLVKRGTLRPGDFIVAGRVHAKIRSLRNEAGVEVDEAPPGTAIEILGWKEPPDAGDQVLQAPDEGKAKAAVRYRQELKERGEVISQMAQQEQDRRERDLERERERALAEAADPQPHNRRRHHRRHQHHNTQAAADAAAAEGEEDPADKTHYVPFLVKGDVHGSVEAVTAALLEQGNNDVRAKVLVSAPGQITESDVEHAAVIPAHIKRLAADAGVKILEHNVIYHLVEEVRERMIEALPPLILKKVVGEAEVLQYKNIAGCRIGNGFVKKGTKGRVIREGENVFEGTIETLKHVKKDVHEMKKGSECGISFAGWDELQPGDNIQMLEEYTEKRTL
ncbi:uncharacterized protein B0H64DRAFT_412051 [Chaetomium fimeti]|uniref:Translation initiation factor IF-2, mitochondrial n=1 Tax=Chaetomium fimeti TaxID=1854472 RepID=A0AAE0H899_9PEZI|nr:hypothetical protein B0H64DRAFT_412051 [Chaetomium fimeti]